MLITLTCCTAVPVRDHVEHTLATAARWEGPAPRVVWFGDGCYFVRALWWGGASYELCGTPRARCADVDVAIPAIACRWNVPHRAI
jgi:hypothetical protein